MVTSQGLKELPSVTKLMDLVDDYTTLCIDTSSDLTSAEEYRKLCREASQKRQELQQVIEVVVRKRIEAQVEAEVLKGKLARLGVETRRKYCSVLQEALDALENTHDVGNPKTDSAITAIRYLLGQT